MENFEMSKKIAARIGMEWDRRGFILTTSYLILSLLSIFSLALFSRSNSYLLATERNKNKVVAFNMAEAGFDEAIAQLASNIAYAGSGTYVSMSTATVQGGYQTSVTTPQNNPNVRQIISSGFTPSDVATERAYETRGLIGFVSLQPPSGFQFSIFAAEGVAMSGNHPTIDSYDSSVGPYSPPTAKKNGDVGTNSIAAGAIDIGNSNVKGDAIIGPGGDPVTGVTLGPGGILTGEKQAATSPQNFPVPGPTGTFLGDISLAGSTNYELAGGTYTMSSLSINGTAKITALDPVTVYVTGSVDIGGKGIATSGDIPKNFLIYVTTHSDVKLSGKGAFYGAIYAPLSKVANDGNGALYGAIISKSYKQTGNGDIHFDEGLQKVAAAGHYEVSLLSWRETHTTAGS